MVGNKKRRKRSIAGTSTVEGFKLRWELRSEPQWSTEDGYEGHSIAVERTDGSFRELILQYPFPKAGRTLRISGVAFSVPPNFPIRPDISARKIEADIRRAMAAGWDPDSRGRAFVFEVPACTIA